MEFGLSGLLTANAVLVAGAVIVLWAVSLVVRDASIVDLFWGFGFVLIAWLGFLAGDGDPGRRTLLMVLVSLWGLRLTAYLSWRNLGKGEDFRYVRMRQRWGRRFPLVSLATVFLLQGALMWVVSLPVQAGQSYEGSIGLLGWLGAIVWGVGLGFETVGDLQLARFKADPANAGKVLDRGLWRYTRHPNYFGDFVVWWGVYLVALAAGGAWWSIVGPIVMTVLLMRVSGVTLLEQTIAERRPAYAGYVRTTSAFFPRPPRP